MSFEPESDWESSLRGSEAEIICARSVSDWFNSGHIQISFSHLWILSLYIFFFALNDSHCCNIFSLVVAFSTLMSQCCVFYLNGIFDLEVAFYKFIFDLDVSVSTLMSQCCVFFFHAAFFNLMTFSSSMLHFLLWCHSFAFFTLIGRYSTLTAFSTVNLNYMIRLKRSLHRQFSLSKYNDSNSNIKRFSRNGIGQICVVTASFFGRKIWQYSAVAKSPIKKRKGTLLKFLVALALEH